MEIIKDIKLLREKIEQLSKLGEKTIGLIHTRGPLHEGHRTLIQAARKENYIVVISNILVPREFASREAYNIYPRSTMQDENIASLWGADFFFKPDIEDFEGFNEMIGIKLGDTLKEELNGKGRPSYYEEKLTTLAKLLNMIQPQRLYMSDKDLQQVYFTKEMLKQLRYDCKLRVLPVVRDEENMALGIKEGLLKEDERKQVLELAKIFLKAQTAYKRGMVSSRKIKWHVENEVSKLYLCELEFVELVEPERLRKIETITEEAILMIGIRVGQVRICDYTRLVNIQEKN